MPRRYVCFTEEKLDVARKLYASGRSAKDIMEATGESLRSAQKFISHTRSEFVDGPLRNFELNKKGRKPNNNGELWDAIENILVQECTLTIQQIIERLPGHLKCNRNKVAKVLKQHSYKKKRAKKIPHERNSRANIQARKMYATAMAAVNDDNMIFIDESGFNLHLGPLYGYTPPGITPSVEVPGNRGTNISLLLAIGASKIVGFFTRVGAINSNDYKTFLETVVLPQIEDDIIIMDNARIHHANDVSNFFRENNVRHRYLPPYSPQLNPIEEVFSMIKSSSTKATYRR
ncbi:uncharacterized protein LOC116166371 [Photinus pyralis]|uniref:uncharacterized protein LOC116166371 n=1 Tax=Photinus pyralis TaxID=7054 RepID=UPI00126764AB|nr:uncharacterized protein LOC116166371 [Photinus pyralis]